MEKAISGSRTFDEYLGCFGNFVMQDPVCKTMCALRLRCAIERHHNARMELMEEMVSSSDGISIKAN